MKKYLLIIAAVLGIAFTASAQVKLPDMPTRAAGHTDYVVKETGYWFGALLDGYLVTAGNGIAGATQLNIINGYRFSEFLKVGIGVAPRYYFIGGQAFSLPIYADVRGNFSPQTDAMFAFCWSADLGYTLNEGIYVSPFIGVRTGDIRHNFTAGISYILQGHEVGPIHLVGLRIGYEF